MKQWVEQYLQRLTDQIETAKSSLAKAESQVELALCKLRTGDNAAATALLDAVRSATEVENRFERARMLCVVSYGSGVTRYQLGHYAEAVSELLNTVEAARVTQMPHIRARALSFLAIACGPLGAHRDAIEYGRAGLEAGTQANDLRAILTARFAMAKLYTDYGQIELANRQLDDARAAVEALQDPFTAVAFENLRVASLCKHASKLAARATNDQLSHDALEKALNDAQTLGELTLLSVRESSHRLSEVLILTALAEVAFLQYKYPKAIALISESYSVASKFQGLDNMAQSLLLWGGYNLAVGRVDEALARLEEGLEYARESGCAEIEAKIHQKLSECYERLGRMLESLNALKRFAFSLESQRNIELADLAKLSEMKHDLRASRVPPISGEDDSGE